MADSRFTHEDPPDAHGFHHRDDLHRSAAAGVAMTAAPAAAPAPDVGLAERLIQALVLYALAECQSGHATSITLRTSGRSFVVSDDGRGHAIRRTVDGVPYLDLIYTHFDYPFPHGPGASVQLQGIGMSLVNAMCSELRITVRKPAETGRLSYRRGRLADESLCAGTNDTCGTTIEGRVRSDLPGGDPFEPRLQRWLLQVQQAHPGLRLHFNDQPLLAAPPPAWPRDAMDAMTPLTTDVAVQAWASGWALSRDTPPPIRCSGHDVLHVGRPGHVTRYVLPRLDPALLRHLVTAEAAPGTWLKICAPVAEVSPLLPDDWQRHAPEFLMATRLAGGPPPPLPGYHLQVDTAGSLARARLVALDTGELAASGQAALEGAFATFDQIVTVESHRRKGLGRHLMAALSTYAMDRGATHGVLVATEAGAALYRSLGWAMVSPVTAASLGAQAVEHLDNAPLQRQDDPR